MLLRDLEPVQYSKARTQDPYGSQEFTNEKAPQLWGCLRSQMLAMIRSDPFSAAATYESCFLNIGQALRRAKIFGPSWHISCIYLMSLYEREELDVQAIQRFWAKSVLNKVMLLMNFSLVFCCCGWTGSIGGEPPAEPVSYSTTRE